VALLLHRKNKRKSDKGQPARLSAYLSFVFTQRRDLRLGFVEKTTRFCGGPKKLVCGRPVAATLYPIVREHLSGGARKQHDALLRASMGPSVSDAILRTAALC
jgi:hypothetical protein